MSDAIAANRRSVLKAAGLGSAAIAGSGLLAACGSSLKGSGTSSTDTLKIGYVSPQTGPLASFASADNYIISQVRNALAKGITAGGKNRKIEIVVKDSQSTTTRATQVTHDLILTDKVDIVVASSTPDVTNPVADTCEANAMPNVSTIAPWEAWYFGRGAKQGDAFKYTTLFFFGLKQFTDLFSQMWDRSGVTTDNVACLWPNDTDGNAFREGFPPAMKPTRYKPIDAGGYQDDISDFSAQISRFKAANCELFTCAPLPPDFQTFWKQAAQQNYKPKFATVAKVMLFPSEAVALGSLSNNIATDCWWSPYHPYKSTLDGTTPQQLADGFAASTGNQWTQALGSIYSLFEIAVQAFQKADDPKNHESVATELKNMKIDGMSGNLDFTTGPVPGVAIQQVVGAQWRPGTKFPWDMFIVDNSMLSVVPLNGDLKLTNA
jgi:branched-chain amino acid transport system substrate-binding protein